MCSDGASGRAKRTRDVRSPSSSTDTLPGTTRDLCLKLALRARIPVRIAAVPAASLAKAEESLICFASRGVC